jgi:hypothetical protein
MERAHVTGQCSPRRSDPRGRTTPQRQRLHRGTPPLSKIVEAKRQDSRYADALVAAAAAEHGLQVVLHNDGFHSLAEVPSFVSAPLSVDRSRARERPPIVQNR